ncbi:carbohydrate ABC transporter permease [Marinactinospora thermotolerans]|uniref:Carbohydrate ABC transporter membrane protein 1, CUT1 family n=1 Tax=Marinactinospora thermotolerans DSM 45154 TaxID=1122192 RepID=A0A1T4T5U5_9ACTN|nr:sugar ABC transporter permease [Marinactinospora thermotolerans]SKA35689.1 carbohydrate ABC transporter membrane protein 1, CUT1 family [Marinactinospora thermotolerans DSM 45154]
MRTTAGEALVPPQRRSPEGMPAGRGGAPDRRDAMQRRMARIGWGYTSPSLLVIGLVTLFPIVFSLVLSFARVRITYDGFAVEALTLGNYVALLGSGDWYYALGFTVLYTVVTVAIELVLGTLAALVLERLGAGRGWIMALLLIPWSMITVVSAQLWAYIYNSTYGVATWVFESLFGTAPLILGRPVSAIAGMMVADIWKTTPFVAIIVLAGLVMLPQDVYEAADVDGAGPWTTFWRVTLPQLRSTIAVAILFRILQAFGVFDLPFVLTGGGPGIATQSLAVMGYKTLFQDLNIGPGAAIAASTGLLVAGACLLFLRAFKAQVGKEDVT